MIYKSQDEGCILWLVQGELKPAVMRLFQHDSMSIFGIHDSIPICFQDDQRTYNMIRAAFGQNAHLGMLYFLIASYEVIRPNLPQGFWIRALPEIKDNRLHFDPVGCLPRYYHRGKIRRDVEGTPHSSWHIEFCRNDNNILMN